MAARSVGVTESSPAGLPVRESAQRAGVVQPLTEAVFCKRPVFGTLICRNNNVYMIASDSFWVEYWGVFLVSSKPNN